MVNDARKVRANLVRGGETTGTLFYKPTILTIIIKTMLILQVSEDMILYKVAFLLLNLYFLIFTFTFLSNYDTIPIGKYISPKGFNCVHHH